MTEQLRFQCEHCLQWVMTEAPGVRNRNHCPFCLWSKHLDAAVGGDRKSACRSLMKPLGLTFKKTAPKKYGTKSEEIMLIHQCQIDGSLSINRIAGDDSPGAILAVLRNSKNLSAAQKRQIDHSGISLIPLAEIINVSKQLLGNDYDKGEEDL